MRRSLKMTDLICVGAISGAFGVKGELRIKSFTADPGAISGYTPLTTEDGKTEFALTLIKPINNGFCARISGVATKEAADALRGIRLFTARDQLPNLPDDEYYHADLVGLAVLDTGGSRVGHVKSVQNHGAGDLLEIHDPALKNTVLLPFTMAAVPTVDLASKRVIIDPPEGLF